MASQTNVVQDGHTPEQLNLLKRPRQAQSGSLVGGIAGDVLALEDELAFLGTVQSVDAVHHARFSRSVGPDYGENLTLSDLEAHIGQRGYTMKRQEDVLSL